MLYDKTSKICIMVNPKTETTGKTIIVLYRRVSRENLVQLENTYAKWPTKNKPPKVLTLSFNLSNIVQMGQICI